MKNAVLNNRKAKCLNNWQVGLSVALVGKLNNILVNKKSPSGKRTIAQKKFFCWFVCLLHYGRLWPLYNVERLQRQSTKPALLTILIRKSFKSYSKYQNFK